MSSLAPITEISFANYTVNESIEINSTAANHELPDDMRFTEDDLLSIIVYTILMVTSGIGNLLVFGTLYRNQKHRKSRINMMIMHLAIADLCVTLLNMPLEIAWKATVSWKAGDAMCRIMSFFRVFGLFLSSYVLICISVDRYAAIKYPLRIQQAHRRGKYMVIGSWFFATVCSAPQMYIFHVEKHYKFTWYKQCITFGTFENTAQELTYNMLGFIGMYAVPLLVIITCYAGILIELNKQTSNNKKVKSRNSSPQLRRSGTGNIGKAKIQTIKMTSVIVTAFVVCWTPYYVICLWHWFFKSSATKIDKKIQKILFIFAVSNSCLNPLVYGYFSVVSNARRKICSCFYPNNNSKRRSPEQSRTRPTFIRTTSNVNSANYTQPLDYTSILKTEDTCNKKDGIFTTPL